MPITPLNTAHANDSVYTLHTVRRSENEALITPTTPSYGATFPTSPTRPSPKSLIANAAIKMICIFLVSTLLLGGTLWLSLPTLEPQDRQYLRIPRSFSQLQDLNALLKKYRDIYPYRILICYTITYLFLQAFSIPGSMYLSILGGAVWGVARALPLVCFCVATGATLCYFISAALGPALLTLPKWKARLDQWATKIQNNRDNLLSFLIVIRIAPLPPHWVVNIVCPHIGIGVVPFWISTALGILGVSVIHTTIGGGLDEMTSADDFHIISWRNFFGLAVIAIGVLIPVGIRWWFRRKGVVADISDPQAESGYIPLQNNLSEDSLIAISPRVNKPDDVIDGDVYESSDEDDDEDIILESGPAPAHKDGAHPLL